MNVRSSTALVVLAVLAGTAPARGQTPEPPVETPPSAAPVRTGRGPLFTAEEIDRARALAAAHQEQIESYIRATDDVEVIILAPYIVEGDSSLLLARLRRDLDQRSNTSRQRWMTLEPTVLLELNLTRRHDEQFFRGPNAGAPADWVAPGDWLGLSLGIFAAVVEGRAKDIFRAPDVGPGNSPARRAGLFVALPGQR